MKEAYERAGIEAMVFKYIDDMGWAYGLANLVVCRAGALTLAELAIFGKPAILIPYPYSAEGHQVKNARRLVEICAAKMILDSDLTGRCLAEADK